MPFFLAVSIAPAHERWGEFTTDRNGNLIGRNADVAIVGATTLISASKAVGVQMMAFGPANAAVNVIEK